MSNSTAYANAYAAYRASSAKTHEVYEATKGAMEAEYKGRNWREYEKDPAYIAAKAPYEAAMKAQHEAHDACRAAGNAWAAEVAAEVRKNEYPIPVVTKTVSKNGKKFRFLVDGVQDRESSRQYTHLLLVLAVTDGKVAWHTTSEYSQSKNRLQAEALKRGHYVHGDTCNEASKTVFCGWKVVEVVG